MKLKNLLPLWLSLLSSISGTLSYVSTPKPTVDPLRDRLDRHLSESTLTSSTPIIRTALTEEQINDDYCLLRFGWAAKALKDGSTKVTLYNYHEEEELKQESKENGLSVTFDRRLKIFSITASTNDIPIISPRPSKQNTLGNETTIVYDNGLNFPATITIKLPDSVLWVNSLIYTVTGFATQINEPETSKLLPLEKQSIKPETPGCAKFILAGEDSRRFMRKQRDLLIGVLLGGPLSVLTVGILICIAMQSRQNSTRRPDEELQLDLRIAPRPMRNPPDPNRASTRPGLRTT